MLIVGVLCAASLSVGGNFAIAQPFESLEDIQERVALPYIPTRCAALHQAVMEWGGETRLGSELWRQTDELRQNFIVIAALASQQMQGGTAEQVTNSVVRDVRNIADIYLDRFERNYATSGQAFDGDTIIRSDLDYCRVAAEMLMQ
jgi:hypothetical protein